MKIDFDVSKVTHLEADTNYTNIHFIDGVFMKKPFTLKRFEDHPALGCSFIRVNRGTIIQKSFINWANEYEVALVTGAIFTISRRRKIILMGSLG